MLVKNPEKRATSNSLCNELKELNNSEYETLSMKVKHFVIELFYSLFLISLTFKVLDTAIQTNISKLFV